MTRHVQILSTGSYVPDKVLTNAYFDEILGEPVSDWLVENVGIRERRIMADDQTTSDLIVNAAEMALQGGILGRADDMVAYSWPTRRCRKYPSYRLGHAQPRPSGDRLLGEG